MAETNVSPLKAFMKRLSPSKSRNKPLPPGPREDEASPTKGRAPMRTISANVSPTKDKGGKRKISEMLRGKPVVTEDATTTAPPPPPQPTKHRRISSVPGKSQRMSSAPGSQKQSQPSNDGILLSRVEQLEAELQAAREQLASTATKPTNTTLRKEGSSWRPRPQAGRRAHSFQAHPNHDQDVNERHSRIMKEHRYDGLVESLLERNYESATAAAASYSSRTGRHAESESGRHSALASYREMEQMYMDDEESKTEHLRRKRSELRAAEWKRIQNNFEKSPEHAAKSGSKRGHDSVSAQKEEPPARRQKQSHKAPAESRTRSHHTRRAASESHIPSDLESKRGAGIRQVPIESQPYKIEYVRARPKTPDEHVASRRAQEPPQGRPTYDLMKAFGSNTPNEKAKANENVEVFDNGEEQPEEPKSASPQRRNIPSPSRLDPVKEEYEWDDDIF